ncbi:MAG: PHP domain-containing protein [archaeon]|jgi:hypothetical protein
MPANRILGRSRYPKNLHNHSTFSDGALSPDKLILELKKRGRKHVAITDHDNFGSLVEVSQKRGRNVAQERKYGGKTLRELAKFPTMGIRVRRLKISNGAEFNCNHNGMKIEILAYHFNPKSRQMLALQDTTMGTAQARANSRLNFFKKLGFKIDLKELNPFNYSALDKELLGPKNALLLSHTLQRLGAPRDQVERNPTGTLRSLLFSKEDSEYFAATHEPYAESMHVIDSVRKNGGIAVLAHPLQYFRGLPIEEQEARVTKLVSELKKQGLKGMEVEYVIKPGYYSMDEIKMLRRVARKLKLKVFGGTDYHLSPRDLL